jgi:hypothetical protein
MWNRFTVAWIVPAIAGITLGPGCHSSQDERATSVPGSTAPSGWMPVFRDVEGRQHEPFRNPATRAVAIVFVLADCPIANSYLPELNRLNETYGSRGVVFLLVHADTTATEQAARTHAVEYQVAFPVLLDPQHVLVQRAGATRTPEVALYDRTGALRYRGRIDDRHVALGKRRPQATSYDLREALEAVLAGNESFQLFTEAVGCFIPD